MKTVGFFEESEGKKSSTRLNGFILLFFLMAFDLIYILRVSIESGEIKIGAVDRCLQRACVADTGASMPLSSNLLGIHSLFDTEIFLIENF